MFKVILADTLHHLKLQPLNSTSVQEGDKRYIDQELLANRLNEEILTKADIFSLGLTMYHLESGQEDLPEEGQEWHDLRNGRVKQELVSEGLRSIVTESMMQPNYHMRLSAAVLLKHPCLLGQR